MKKILFIDAVSPVRPLMAADVFGTLGLADVQVEVAVGQRDEAVAVLKAQGVSPLPKIHDPASLNYAAFDLVIRFGGGKDAYVPGLPGIPPYLSWQVDDSALLNGGYDEESLADLQHQIEAMVNNLVGQGYLEALIQTRRSAEQVLDNLYEGIIAHDRQRRIFFFNQAAEKITGFSRHEILGRDCHEVFPERFCKENCSFCEPSSEPDLPAKPYPLVLHTKSGEIRQIEMNVVGMRDFFGSLTGVVASFRDLTREFDLAGRLGEVEKFAGIIGRNGLMQEIYRTITDLADSRVSVLVEGESGTGKELVAAAIHNTGKRSDKLFVPINCGALPEHLLETELFGHVKGAFTGAIRDKKGRFELADGGTLFLDEIGDISPAMQVKLLRVLQDGTFQRVGGEETITVDVRVISASHKDLRAEVAAGRFREDLYYRLCVVPITLPPLRDRRDDIPLLARNFLKRTLEEEGRTDKVVISTDAMDRLVTYHWPGNVRELQNVIRFGLVHCREEMFHPDHLPPHLLQTVTHSFKVKPTIAKQRSKLSEDAVREALLATSGNRLQAAKRLGVGRATLYRFLDKHPVD